ncbi:MAG TPA: FAD-binding oxidoreductase, partial [Anaerolineaceae bacterium]|nr:FAD-binding oxidoreductase [Anaerolineaceae bacterium]
MINAQQQESLQKSFARVSFDRVERKLYGHDIAAMPLLVKPLLGNTVPDAVVQPQSEQDLVRLSEWANENRVALTPRGKATSGYGGVLPVKQGVVVDFYHLKSVLRLDKAALTVTVQPGITWERLDRYLQAHGLTLRLYPSSYPSSTVGGWLAQGGAGFGSYRYGYFRQNVVSARLVLPSGKVKVLSGDDLELAADAEGITGMISAVELNIMPREEMGLIALGAREPAEFQRLIEAVAAADLPVWSVMFINPKMAELKNLAPHGESLHGPAAEPVVLPEVYILTLAYPLSESVRMEAGVQAILSGRPVERLSEAIAHHEWENRFKLMAVKRLGPSLVPSEVVVPLKNLAAALEEIGQKVGQPLVK